MGPIELCVRHDFTSLRSFSPGHLNPRLLGFMADFGFKLSHTATLLKVRQVFSEKIDQTADSGKEDDDINPVLGPAGSGGMHGKEDLKEQFYGCKYGHGGGSEFIVKSKEEFQLLL
jgi:hypothetical protein